MQRRHLLAASATWLTTAILSEAHAQTGVRVEDLAWTDAARQRTLPLRWRWPAGEGACALVMFSHGLGGSRDGGTAWGEAWASAGFAVVHLQHPGSDSEVWRNGGGLAALRRAADAEQYLARVRDARFVLDEIEREIERRAGDGPWRRLRRDAIGFSGHSFGARLTQALAGESRGRADLADARLRAFAAFSPGFSARGAQGAALDAEARERFARVTRPFLCLTGTLDESQLAGDASTESRQAVYRGLPPGRKAGLILEDADHGTFGGQAMPRAKRRDPRAIAHEPAHHALIARLTTDWWRWRLLDDAAAGERLREPVGLGPGDRWQLG